MCYGPFHKSHCALRNEDPNTSKRTRAVRVAGISAVPAVVVQYISSDLFRTAVIEPRLQATIQFADVIVVVLSKRVVTRAADVSHSDHDVPGRLVRRVPRRTVRCLIIGDKAVRELRVSGTGRIRVVGR